MLESISLVYNFLLLLLVVFQSLDTFSDIIHGNVCMFSWFIYIEFGILWIYIYLYRDHVGNNGLILFLCRGQLVVGFKKPNSVISVICEESCKSVNSVDWPKLKCSHVSSLSNYSNISNLLFLSLYYMIFNGSGNGNSSPQCHFNSMAPKTPSPTSSWPHFPALQY